jgi:hypothetical protein
MHDNTAINLYQQLDTRQAAELMDVTPRKLEYMRQLGTGPAFVRVSRKCVKYRLKDLIEFQEANLKRSTIEK